MTSETVADFLISEYDAGDTTLEVMEKILSDYPLKMVNREKKKRGNITQIKEDNPETGPFEIAEY